jgi:ABC-2 type transport system permease protein
MSAVVDGRRAALPTLRVTQWHVIQSEWKKLWTLRSTRWCLLLAVVIMIAAPVIYSLIQMNQWHTLSPHDRRMFDSIDAAAGGHYIAQLVIGFLGVLTVSAEYSTGMIRSSFMAVPRRLPVLWAKFIVFFAVVFLLLLVSNVISFFVVQAIVSVHHVSKSITAPHAIRVVVMDPLIITLVGLLGIALGALTRSTAGGAAVLVFLMFVITGVAALLPQSIANDVNPYLPINAAYTAATSTFDPGPHLSTWGGFGIFCALVAVVVGFGAVRLRGGDA